MDKWIDAFIASLYYRLAQTWRARKRYDDALASYDKAIALNPDYAEAYHYRAITLREIKRYDDALASCDKAIELKPDYIKAYQTRGRIFADKGNMPEAEKMFLKALEFDPDNPTPMFYLTRIRKYGDVDHTDVKAIQKLLDMPGISLPDKEDLYFSLGKIYDDCGRYDDAFEYYRQANRLRNDKTHYNPDEVTRFVNGIIDVFSKEFLAQPFAFASDSQSPMFIIGMPRSGTTLMASILSNHPSVATAGELPTIANSASNLPKLLRKKIPFPQAVKYITPDVAARLINEYEKRLRRDVGPDIPYVIDKHPLNFFRLGFISVLFPKAHVIHCTRDPLDTCLSNYFQRFKLDYNYSFDLQNISHFYGEYARLMGHWRKVLPPDD